MSRSPILRDVPPMVERELGKLSKDDLLAMVWAMASWGAPMEGKLPNAYKYGQVVGCYKILALQTEARKKSLASDYKALAGKVLHEIEGWLTTHPAEAEGMAFDVESLRKIVAA